MPKRRDLVRMTDAEVWSFIETQQSMQFASIGKDGTPHLVTLWFAVVDGAIVFETFTKSQKIVNLARDPRCTLLFEDGDVYHELRGVSIKGRAELKGDEEVVHELSMAVLRRNTPDVPESALEKVSRAQAPKKTGVVIRPERILSWDHRKLDVAY